MALTSPTESLAEEIRALMARKKFSQATLATHLGISQSSMSRRLVGTSPFTVDELYSLAEMFSVDPRQLLQPIEASV